MRILGLDLGTRTVGLALSDQTETIATFYGTIRFEEEHYEEALDQVAEIVAREHVTAFVLGLPKNMNNSVGDAAARALRFQTMLEERFAYPVFLQDERLSTVEATACMIGADMSRKARKKKIDGVAATIILQTYLDRKKG